MKQLIPTLSMFLAQMTSVGGSTHSRDLVVGPAAMHVQDGHQLVRSIPSQCRQLTVVGAREDLRATVSLCAYRVCWDMLVVVAIIVNCNCYMFHVVYLLDKIVVDMLIYDHFQSLYNLNEHI